MLAIAEHPYLLYLGRNCTLEILTVRNSVIKHAGIIQGTFRNAQKIKVIETKQTHISVSNMSIAAVVSAYKVHELLFLTKRNNKEDVNKFRAQQINSGGSFHTRLISALSSN